MKASLVSACALLAFGFSSMAFGHGDHKACKPVFEACKKAAKQKKDLNIKSCIETIKGGGTVEGVTVSAADAAACKGAGAK